MIFMCILLYMIMCMLLSAATSTHFMLELMLYCLHCPTLNNVFVLLLLLYYTAANVPFHVAQIKKQDMRNYSTWINVYINADSVTTVKCKMILPVN